VKSEEFHLLQASQNAVFDQAEGEGSKTATELKVPLPREGDLGGGLKRKMLTLRAQSIDPDKVVKPETTLEDSVQEALRKPW
jgi:hypothetical protein